MWKTGKENTVRQKRERARESLPRLRPWLLAALSWSRRRRSPQWSRRGCRWGRRAGCRWRPAAWSPPAEQKRKCSGLTAKGTSAKIPTGPCRVAPLCRILLPPWKRKNSFIDRTKTCQDFIVVVEMNIELTTRLLVWHRSWPKWGLSRDNLMDDKDALFWLCEMWGLICLALSELD